MDVRRHSGITGQTFCRWERQYPDFEIDRFGREAAAGGKWGAEELLTERSLDKAILQDAQAKAFQNTGVAAQLCATSVEYQVS